MQFHHKLRQPQRSKAKKFQVFYLKPVEFQISDVLKFIDTTEKGKGLKYI